ncbi:MAG TPA: NADH:flavin oxidoreductase [Candidatus Bacteroides pullicola]|uniref:NADH:flavin oxidoreductase n=1 Tax=Candidatus Bacteroides pullicola TaxID=2838475 RepID=A0A9D1ZGJ9_9BACE|nr:NADH:flavin oxidoreductase [Candidatus Bacteroides pullicola]
MKESKLFTPVTLGPLTLRNRTIRSAAFESMCPGNKPSPELLDYHTSVARGGVGMTTVAYAAVTRSGLSFDRQLWMRPEIIPGLRTLTDAVHREGTAASIQLGHCGNMSHKSICGCTPVSASTGFNLYSPTFVRGLRADELPAMARAYADSVRLAHEAGFDAVEVHAGHGYLISQFLSPYTNHRRDLFGGSLANRMRFMEMVMSEVMHAAAETGMAVLVKTNMRDGFRGGMEIDECLKVAHRLQELGAHALVLSGGFVSKAPMYVMRGEMPIRTMTHYMTQWWLKYGVRMVGKWMIPTVPFKEAYFLEDALKFRKELTVPLVYVGGLVSREKIDEVLDHGFEAVQMGRALLNEPGFVNRMKAEECARCQCRHSNYCIARMYTLDMACHQRLTEPLPKSLVKEIEEIEKRQSTDGK